MSLIKLTNGLNDLQVDFGRLDERVDGIESRIESLMEEIKRLQNAKRPDRQPIRVPKPPKALMSIGVGLPKG